jgi:hypothetical protein
MGTEEEEVQVKEIWNIFNKVKKNFPNLEQQLPIQIQKVFRSPNRQDQNRTSPHHMLKTSSIENKERILKSEREKRQITYNQKKDIRITAVFSTETLKTRRAQNNVSYFLKENNCQPRILYPEKLSLIIEEEIETFHYEQKLKQFIATKSAL